MTWSISVKTVGSGPAGDKHVEVVVGDQPGTPILEQGNGFDSDSETSSNAKNNCEGKVTSSKPSFTITVDPDMPVSKLHESIEAATGLKTEQQRLIYRGRIIQQPPATPVTSNTNNEEVSASPEGVKNGEMKIRDVRGLDDGHTIHLVPRLASPTTPTTTADAGVDNTDGDREAASSSAFTRSLGGGDGLSSVLATLLGLGATSSGFVTPMVVRSASNESQNSNENEGVAITTSEGTVGRSPTATLRRLDGVQSSLGRGTDRFRPARAAARGRRGFRGASDPSRASGRPSRREPGNLEVVRQGMLTLHSMISSKHSTVDGNDDVAVDQLSHRNGIIDTLRSTVRSRTFYRGQWIDVRDTVNQWLGATILDVALPRDILGTSSAASKIETNSNNVVQTQPDGHSTRELPVINADDLDGRHRLLLQSVDDGVERADNGNVQLLLVHYNGWPRRWDEWIRSDSERIRPFRTRTMHLPMSSLQTSPVMHSTHADAPSTTVLPDERDVDAAESCDVDGERYAVLCELRRILGTVDHLLLQTLEGGHDQEDLVREGLEDEELLKLKEREDEKFADEELDESSSRHVEGRTGSYHEQLPWLRRRKSGRLAMDNGKTLKGLAPLLDRLGRTLTDAAPHIHSLAEALAPKQGNSDYRKSAESQNGNDSINAGGVGKAERECLSEENDEASSLDLVGRQQRTMTDLRDEPSDHQGELESDTKIVESTTSSEIINDVRESDDNRNDEYDDRSQPMSRNASGHETVHGSATIGAELDDELNDFINGMVNVSSPRLANRPVANQRHTSQATAPVNNAGGSILTSYLASTGLASRGLSVAPSSSDEDERDVDDANSNGDDGAISRAQAAIARLFGGGNIDIHIHAVVTPGFGGPGGIAIASVPTATPVASIGNAGEGLSVMQAERNLPQISVSDEDLGLFDDLYAGISSTGTAGAANVEDHPIVRLSIGNSDRIPPILDDAEDDFDDALSLTDALQDAEAALNEDNVNELNNLGSLSSCCDSSEDEERGDGHIVESEEGIADSGGDGLIVESEEGFADSESVSRGNCGDCGMCGNTNVLNGGAEGEESAQTSLPQGFTEEVIPVTDVNDSTVESVPRGDISDELQNSNVSNRASRFVRAFRRTMRR